MQTHTTNSTATSSAEQLKALRAKQNSLRQVASEQGSVVNGSVVKATQASRCGHRPQQADNFDFVGVAG